MSALSIVLAAALTIPTPALAESRPEVAVWRLAPGKLPKAKLPALQQAVVSAAGKLPGAGVVAAGPAAQKALKQLEKRRCVKPTVPCAVEAGSSMGATHVIAGVVKGARPFELELWLVDVAAGKKVASAQGTLRPANMADDVAAVVGKLSIAFRPSVGSVAVSSNVDGAEVRLDGRLIGRTPFPTAIADVAVGTHEIHVAAEGHMPYAGSLEVRQGAEVRIFAELNKTGAPLAAPIAPVGGASSTAAGDGAPAKAAAPASAPTAVVAAASPEAAVAVESDQAKDSGAEVIQASSVSSTGMAAASRGRQAAPAGITEAAGIGLSLSAGPVLLVPTARVGTTGGGTLDLTYFPPLFSSPSLRRMLGVSLEMGWYPLSGRADSSFSAYSFNSGAAAWTTTAFVADWRIQTFPARLALMFRLSPAELARLGGFARSLLPEVYGRLGGAAAYGKATATLSKPGETAFASNNVAEDFAWGFYAAVGGGIGVGPGTFTLEYQYSNLRLDFRFPEWNPELGDLGGNTWRLGYRLDF